MTDGFNLRAGLADGRFTLETLNSLTKYPSIKTYHPLGEKGLLKEVDGSTYESAAASGQLPPVASFRGITDITEKIDGTNARVIVLPDGTVVVGSREELLYARGDLIKNPQLGIVPTLLRLGVVDRAPEFAGSQILVVYGEVYGTGIGPGAKYARAGQRRTGFRAFDVAYVPTENLLWDAETSARWRDSGGQRWYSGIGMESLVQSLGAERVPLLGSQDAERLPKTIAETADWLARKATESRASLFGDRGVEPEGVVLRGFDPLGERLLAKIRYEDYRRTLKKRS